MTRRLPLIALLLITTVCAYGASGSDQLPTIGAKVQKPHNKSANNSVTLWMTHPAQIDPCFEYVFDGVRYTVAYSSETKRVTYLYTVDKNFRTADGLKVGDEIEVSEETVRAWPGWEIHGPTTTDGWRPVIGFDALVNERYPYTEQSEYAARRSAGLQPGGTQPENGVAHPPSRARVKDPSTATSEKSAQTLVIHAQEEQPLTPQPCAKITHYLAFGPSRIRWWPIQARCWLEWGFSPDGPITQSMCRASPHPSRSHLQ